MAVIEEKQTKSTNDPAYTYTLADFVELGKQDELVYTSFAIQRIANNITFADQSVIDFYIKELRNSCKKVTGLTAEEISRYKYRPDLLAFDVYGSVQLDFLVLLCNGIIDPKDFNLKKSYIMLPTKDYLGSILSAIYNSEYQWIEINRNSLKE